MVETSAASHAAALEGAAFPSPDVSASGLCQAFAAPAALADFSSAVAETYLYLLSKSFS
ncbi:hypothetical protein CHCC20375_1353 [Bacillus licheniformis]|nr:hypothetical protein CHCC20375_1353 [Bacillus licheniformis]